jgi:hypothetical protein
MVVTTAYFVNTLVMHKMYVDFCWASTIGPKKVGVDTNVWLVWNWQRSQKRIFISGIFSLLTVQAGVCVLQDMQVKIWPKV